MTGHTIGNLQCPLGTRPLAANASLIGNEANPPPDAARDFSNCESENAARLLANVREVRGRRFIIACDCTDRRGDYRAGFRNKKALAA
jgi:hypothetical protein